MNLSKTLPLAAVLISFSIGPRLAHAAVITQTYSGTFPATVSGALPDQSSVLEESFTLTAASDVTAYTTSYASGGFEPNLTLFDPSGTAIAASVPQGSGPNATGPTDLEAYLSDSALAAGTYTLALMDWQVGQSLTATNLSDGFTFNLGNGTTFIDQNGSTRTGNYVLDFTAVPSANNAVPEPGTIWLTACLGLLLLSVSHKRSNKVQ